MITTINIDNLGDGKINFAESLLNNSLHILTFFNKWLGLLGRFIVLVTIIPFLALILFIFSFYLKNLAKKVSQIKVSLLKEIPTYSFEQIKELESVILPIDIKFSDLNKKIISLGSGFILFKQVCAAITSVHYDFAAINQSLQNRYTYSIDELSKEQLQAVTTYWDNVRKKKPEAYKILSTDKSGEEIVFNSKKRP